MASRDYPDDFVYKALELAAAIGIRPAAKRLAIAEATLRGWTRDADYGERWAELRRINAPKWRERAAIPLEDLVDEYAEAEAELLKQLMEERGDLDTRDIATALRSIAVAKGVTADHVGKLRGQPNNVTEVNINVPQLEQAITALLQEAQEAVNSTATEEPPLAELAPPAQDGP